MQPVESKWSCDLSWLLMADKSWALNLLQYILQFRNVWCKPTQRSNGMVGAAYQLESHCGFLQYLALDATANCICEIHCLALDGFYLNTVHKLSSKEKNLGGARI